MVFAIADGTDDFRVPFWNIIARIFNLQGPEIKKHQMHFFPALHSQVGSSF